MLQLELTEIYRDGPLDDNERKPTAHLFTVKNLTSFKNNILQRSDFFFSLFDTNVTTLYKWYNNTKSRNEPEVKYLTVLNNG